LLKHKQGCAVDSRYDQPSDDSWRDRITADHQRVCDHCGKREADWSDVGEYLVRFLCEDCLRQLWRAQREHEATR